MTGQYHKFSFTIFLTAVCFVVVNYCFAKGPCKPLPLQFEKGFTYRITKSKGVLISTVKDANLPFVLYNSDGSVYKKHAFIGKYASESVNIEPYMVYYYNPYHLVFDCRIIKGKYYGVPINKKCTSIKYIRIDDPYFKFESWQKFILNDSGVVDFNPEITPLKQLPSLKSKTIAEVSGEKYYPVKIKGDWLQLKYWGDTKYEYCWVQWKRNGCIVIQPFAY